MSEEIRQRVLQLIKQRDKIEDNIKQLTEILTLNGVGMNDPLVDSEGFPINSIDVYQVRHARHRIICNIDSTVYNISNNNWLTYIVRFTK
jgi:26S proteasome non-ATPase regulatory subunit 9